MPHVAGLTCAPHWHVVFHVYLATLSEAPMYAQAKSAECERHAEVGSQCCMDASMCPEAR